MVLLLHVDDMTTWELIRFIRDADTMITVKEGPDIGGWQENLLNMSTRKKEVVDSSKWLAQ